MKKIEQLDFLKEKNEFLKSVEKFFQKRDLNIFFDQIYQEQNIEFENLNYLFEITNKNSIEKRKENKILKYFSFSTNLLNALFYLDLRFIKEPFLGYKLDNDFLKKQNEPVLLILDFKEKKDLVFKKGIENFEILVLMKDFSFFKEKMLILDSFLKFEFFLDFLKKKNRNFNFKNLEYFKKKWQKIEEFNKKVYQ